MKMLNPKFLEFQFPQPRSRRVLTAKLWLPALQLLLFFGGRGEAHLLPAQCSGVIASSAGEFWAARAQTRVQASPRVTSQSSTLFWGFVCLVELFGLGFFFRGGAHPVVPRAHPWLRAQESFQVGLGGDHVHCQGLNPSQPPASPALKPRPRLRIGSALPWRLSETTLQQGAERPAPAPPFSSGFPLGFF